jgi:hypothetical protein
MGQEYAIEITQKGRSGEIIYGEEGGKISFYWEFGGGRCVAILYGPSEQEWTAAHPWARGRREAIFRRVGEYVVREKAGGCTPEYDLQNSWINILSPD